MDKINTFKSKRHATKFEEPLMEIISIQNSEIITNSGLTHIWDPNLETERI